VTLTPQLLEQLRTAGLGILQHRYFPRDDEWFAGHVDNAGQSYGDVGPYKSAEEALAGGVAWLVRLADTAQHERDAALDALVASRDEVEALKRVIASLRDELRAEREAK
jgi:hypothetical protein